MKTALDNSSEKQRNGRAFTLIETLVATVVCGIVFAGFYASLAAGFGVIENARENLRATQVLEEKMEVIRLYTWEQINSNGFVPTTFTAPFYPSGDPEKQGFTFNGTITLTNSGMAESYADEHIKMIVGLNWTNANIVHHRQASTLVSKFGIHQYVYTQK